MSRRNFLFDLQETNPSNTSIEKKILSHIILCWSLGAEKDKILTSVYLLSYASSLQNSLGDDLGDPALLATYVQRNFLHFQRNLHTFL